MLKKLRLRFVCVIMAIVTVTLAAIFGLLYYFTQQNLEEESVAMMESVAANPFQLGRPNVHSSQVRLPYFMIKVGASGEVTAVVGGYYDLSDEAFLRALMEAVGSEVQDVGVVPEYNLRFLKVRTPLSQTLVFADMTSEKATLLSLGKTCAALGALCLAVFFGIAMALAHWMVRPVEQAWQQQRQFVADASHELKTPLTVITTNAELLQMPDADPDSARRSVSSILTMSHQMRQLVERLLELARADSGQNKLVLEQLDLSALVEDGTLPFEAVFFEAGLTLASDIQPGIQVTGSRQHLGQLVDILLDNARKYAAGGEVRLTLQKTHRHRCRLTVSNAAPDMTKEQLANIFKRFYRMDEARSRDGSFGLGLSIAENIVTAHGGKIWAESSDGRFTVLAELPVKEEK